MASYVQTDDEPMRISTHKVRQDSDAAAHQWVKYSEVSQRDAKRGDQSMLVSCDACQIARGI